MRLTYLAAASLLLLAATEAAAQPPLPPLKLARLYQGRREPEQSDRVSRKIRLGRNGRVSLSNISGTVVVNGVAGDEMTIDAVKHGARGSLDRVRIVIDDRPGRVDISTEYDRLWRSNNVDVDYTVSVPDDAALDLKSVSGDVRVTGVKGSVRAQAVSGNVTTNNASRVEWAKSVSGDVVLAGVAQDGDLSLQSVSGRVRATGLKVRGLDVTTVSGDISLDSATVDRLNARIVSGTFEYSGALARNGRYDVNTHSGDIRFTLSGNTGFELNATSFSGEIRSGIPLTLGDSTRSGGDVVIGGRGRGRGHGRGPGQSISATSGDGSARLELRSFSGNVVISKR